MKPSSAQKTLLIVDDEPDILDIFATEFRGLGKFKVITATNGSEAFIQCHNNRPDVILSDFRMPKMNGAELLAAVRKTPESAKTPIIFMTGHPEEVRKAVGIDGLAYILEKPCAFEDVQLMVDAAADEPDTQSATSGVDRKTGAAKPATGKPEWDEPLVRETCKAIIESVSNLSQTKGTDSSMSFLLGTQTLSSQISGRVTVEFENVKWQVSIGFPEPTFQKFIHKVMGSNAAGKLSGFEGTALEALKSALTAMEASFAAKKAKVNFESAEMSGSEWTAPELLGKSQGAQRVISFKSPFGIFYVLVNQS